MSSVFVDTSSSLMLGLLNDDYSWIKEEETTLTKSSAVLHKKIFDFLLEEKTSVAAVSKYFFIAGPGSYTGIRLSDGMKQVFEWQKKECFSFYHFDVPLLLGETAGIWCTYGFKDEYFVHEWNNEESKDSLLSASDFLAKYLDKKIYSEGASLTVGEHSISTTSTREMIKNSSSLLFENVSRLKEVKKPFYFRHEQVEFQKAKGA